jgi:2-polyprenyl-6-methoxyphenol hydroxylase-like FAD-dependent oxidoreductase
MNKDFPKMNRIQSATACIVGGGPAGAMLGLLLARAGVHVTVLEKHADFLRDFRGDTVHPATVDVLDQLRLSEKFFARPHQKIGTFGIIRDGRYREMAAFDRLKVPFPFITMIAQWDFLDFLTAEASRYPNFTLRMRTSFCDVLRKDRRICGIRYRDDHGDGEIRAGLVVGADGRRSAVRDSVGLLPVASGVPIDVVLFRISRRESDPEQVTTIRIEGADILGLIDRGTYWQAFVEIPKGDGIVALRAAGINAFRDKVVRLAPFLADRVDEVESVDALNFLDVRADRLRRWHVPGLIAIGDAAHSMSPVGGFGINLAIQDAVAAANLLTDSLLRYQQDETPVPSAVLAAVQRRRALPTVMTQLVQRIALWVDLGGVSSLPAFELPGGVRPLPRLMGRLIGYGFRPERVRHARILSPAVSGQA